MASLVQELLIKIGIKSDTAQGKDAAASVERIGNAVKATAPEMQKAGTASKDMAQNMGRGIEVGNATTALMQNLGNASKGGAEGMFAAARATASFAQVVKGIVAGAGPIGLAIAAIGLLGGAVFALKDKFSEPKQSIDDFKAKLADLDKASITQLDATLGALSDRLKAAKEEADAVRQSLDMIDDAEMGAKLSANKASGLDDKEKQRQEFLIRDEFKARKQAREKEAAEMAVSQANETRDALAPQFEDARNEYASLLNEVNSQNAGVRALDGMKQARDARLSDKSNTSYLGSLAGMAETRKINSDIKAAQSKLLDKDGVDKLNARVASAEERFQGKDGSGGISAKYQSAVDAAEKSDKALRRLLTTREEVDKWDKARVRLENGGVDPRDTEAAARRSSGKARVIGPDGTAREYDVGAPTTANQGIAAAAIAAKNGQTTSSFNQITRGKLAPGSDTIAGAASKVADAAGTTESASSAAQESLAKIADGASKIADAGQQLATGVSTAATDLGTANDGLASAIAAATADLGAAVGQSVALGAQNVTAYAELSSQVRDLAQQVRTAMSQLAAARSRK